MRNPRTITNVVLLAGLIASAAIVLVVMSHQDPSSLAFTAQEKSSKNEDEKKMPIAVYSTSLPADSAQRTLRLARNGRYDKRYTVPFDVTSPDTTGRSSINDWYVYMSALPATESDLVVLGEVTSANGYLSNDRTGAYSEFSIHVNDVLKGDGRQSDRSIIAVREGADVQLPSGRVIRYEIVYQGMPRVNRQYVFFLRYNESGKDYTILTGYELRNNRVSPLDEVEPFTTYKIFDESSFLQAVREAIAQPPEKKRLNQL
jgi:hypothetical protein